MDIRLNKIIAILLLLVSLNVWSVCQNDQLFSFHSLEDLNKLAFQDCTSTRNDNRKKCDCQKHNSKIIPDVSNDLQVQTQEMNMDDVKKNIQQNIDEMIQYFLALETNIEVSDQAAQACSLARIQQIKCNNSKTPILNHLYANGNSDLLKQSQCQLKRKYNLPCDQAGLPEIQNSSSCLDEGTRLALIFKEREEQSYLEKFKQKIATNSLIDLQQEIHPALKLILQDANLQKQFLALPSQKLQDFVKSPALSGMISQNISLACEQKMQNMQSLLCSDVENLNQIPLKNIVKTEKALIKQKSKDLDAVISYQQQLNLFCHNLEKPSLEKKILELNKSSMPTSFENVLIATEKKDALICAKLSPPIDKNQVELASKSCTNQESFECLSLNNLKQLLQARESTKPTLASGTELPSDATPVFFSKQLKIFFGQNTNPALIPEQAEGNKVSVANYHEEMLERDQARARSHQPELPQQPMTEIAKTKNVIPVVSSNGTQLSPQQTKNNFDFYNHSTGEQIEMSKRQAQFLEHERKNNSQIMKHFQNINQKQIDMIEKMANRIIDQNELPGDNAQRSAQNHDRNTYNSPQSFNNNAGKQPTIQVGGTVATEPTNQIVYIDNNQGGSPSEKLNKPSSVTSVDGQGSNNANINTIARDPASSENGSTLQHVEVIHKDQTIHKKYDEIIVSLDFSEGDQLSKLKPHELEKISKYLEEKRPFILKKILKNSNNTSKNIDATILVGDQSYITIIPNKKISPSEQKEYLLIKKELENIMKLKLSQNTLDMTTTSRL